MKPIRTLVLLANDAHARLFENHGVGKGLVEIEDLAKSMLPDTEIRYADQPGRSSAAPGMARHVMDPSESEHDQMRTAFAGHVVAATEALWKNRGYDRFVMAAGPGMLGVLRTRLPKTLKKALVADLDKDLLKADARDLVGHFKDKIVF